MDIISPPCQDGVGVNSCVLYIFKETKKRLSHGILEGFATLFKTSNER